MSNQLLSLVEPLELARLGRRFSGEIPIAKLKRLRGLLASGEGRVYAELAFDTDEKGIPFVSGQVQAEVELQCQRCLETFRHPMAIEFCLGIVESEAEEQLLPEYYEPLLLPERRIHMSDIVEDELVLALPSVPVHPHECREAFHEHDGAEEKERERDEADNPFAILKKLKSS